MAAPLAKEWRTFTQEDPCPPDLKALQKFVMVRKTIAPGVTPTSINKSDKTDKIVKPKNNPYLKRNTQRIQEASKAVDTSSSNRKVVQNVETIIISLRANSSGILRHRTNWRWLRKTTAALTV